MRKLVLVFMFAALATSAWAQPVPIRDIFRVDGALADSLFDPAMARGADGATVVVWGTPAGGDAASIRGRLFHPDGTVAGDELRIDSPDADSRSEFNPDVAKAAGGDFLVVWDTVGPPFNIKGRAFKADGSPHGEEFQINTVNDRLQSGPAVAPASGGGFLVVWTSSAAGILGRRFTADGSAMDTGTFEIHDRLPLRPSYVDIAVGPDGFLVVWDEDLASLRARRLDRDGRPVGGSVEIDPPSVRALGPPRSAIGPAGEALVVWSRFPVPTLLGNDIFGRRLAPDGTLAGEVFRVNSRHPATYTSPDVAATTDGDFFVTWVNRGLVDGQPDNRILWGRIFTADASPISEDFQISPRPLRRFGQNVASVAAGPDQEVLVVWIDSKPDSREDSVRGRRYIVPPRIVDLRGGRVRTEVSWRDFEDRRGVGSVVVVGDGAALTTSDDSVLYFFFNPGNWELMVKVLDGCALNGHFWVFGSSSTDVEYELRVTDTLTGRVWTRMNPLGVASPAITDTTAFATCDAGDEGS